VTNIKASSLDNAKTAAILAIPVLDFADLQEMEVYRTGTAGSFGIGHYPGKTGVAGSNPVRFTEYIRL